MRARDSDRGCYSIGTAIKLSFGAEITLLLQDTPPSTVDSWLVFILFTTLVLLCSKLNDAAAP